MRSVKIINQLIPFDIRPDLVLCKVSNPELVFLVSNKRRMPMSVEITSKYRNDGGI
jgi:hypothetical protein